MSMRPLCPVLESHLVLPGALYLQVSPGGRKRARDCPLLRTEPHTCSTERRISPALLQGPFPGGSRPAGSGILCLVQ